MALRQNANRDNTRPCDNCRRGKRGCDGPDQLDLVCTRCTRLHKVCSYTDAVVPLRTTSKGYVQALESRLAVVERILQQHVPGALLMQELGAPVLNIVSSARFHAGGEGNNNAPETPLLAPTEQWDDVVALSSHPHGFSSRDHEETANFNVAPTMRRRPEFWTVPACEFRGERFEDRDFQPVLPPPDQMAPLVQKYFDTWNAVYPIFHRPLFEQQLLTIHETRDKHFMAALLLVCALGEGRLAREKQGSPDDERLAGWKHFVQVEPFLRIPTPSKPQLLDVQIYYLAAAFTSFHRGSSAFWLLHGVAVELAFLANAHRRSRYRQHQPNLQDELWKRTFWSLVVGDRMAAYVYGRPLIIKDESFDLELPLEVDDSHWDITTPGYPLRDSPIEHGSCSFLVWHIRLALILGISVQALYANNRARLLMGFVGADWEQGVTNRLDELLDEWVTHVPSYLKWDPDVTDLGRFIESSILNSKYYALKIMAHNPFMRTTARNFSSPSRSTTALDLQSSLEICTQAALECSDLMMVVIERYPQCLALPGWVDPPFVCGLVLLVSLFGSKACLPEVQVTQYATYVRICLDVLQIVSAGQKTAGQRWEILHQLASDLEFQLPPSVHAISAPPIFRPRSQQSERWTENPSVPWSPMIPPGLTPHAAPVDSTSTQGPTKNMSHAAPAEPDTLPYHFNLSKLPPGLTDQMSTGLRHPIPLYPVLDAGDTRLQPVSRPSALHVQFQLPP